MFPSTQTQMISLADIEAGDTFEILPSFSGHPEMFGRFRPLATGGQFFCRSAGAATLLLVGNDRRTMSVPRDMARFIAARRMTARLV
jgi:hypothetical protein